MKLIRKFIGVTEIRFSLLFITFIACSSQRNTDEPAFIDIFIAGKENAYGQNNQPYARFREQNVTITASGKIVVVVQGRNISDWSDRSGQDLWCKISNDNGLTWTEPILMDSQGEKSICPNASVYDGETGRILSLYTVFEWPYTDPESRKTWKGLKNREYIIYSDDEGYTWSKPREITHMVKTDTVIQVFGSGEGIQLKTGDRKGRLIIPGGDFYPPNKRVFAWISDDHGETWKSSEVVPNPHNRLTPCENAIVELADGSLLMNERNQDLGQRWQSYSIDAGETWSPFEPVMDLPSVSCNASIIRINYNGKDILLYAGPVGPDPEIQNGKDYEGFKFRSGERRSNGVVFASYDNGKTWPFRKLVVPGQFAYSSLRELPDRTVGLFYETNFHKDVKLVKFSHEWLFNNELNNRLQYIDISNHKEQQVTVEKISGQYLGQPNTVLLADGKTIIVGYPEGHGHPNTILKKSEDGGLTWSDRLKTPGNFIDDHYAPTLHRLTDPKGKERIIIFVVTPYVMTSISEDNGQTWMPFKPVYPGENHKYGIHMGILFPAIILHFIMIIFPKIPELYLLLRLLHMMVV